MWISDRWREYKVLDASDGEKLEDWGGYLLVRPDPGVLWSTGKRHEGWRSADAYYHRSPRGGGSWEIRNLPETWDIHYELESTHRRALTLHLKPFKFKHTGVFPEQAANWDLSFRLIRERCLRGDAREPSVLNLFAYTGGATIAAAHAGARVTHVDASRGMVSWARDNALASGLKDAYIRYLVDDSVKFVQRELRRGSRYDVIIMDPPSYGRGPKGEVWKMEDDIFNLVSLAAGLLGDDPILFLLNSYTTGLQPGVLGTILDLALNKRGIRASGGMIEADELGLPISGTDLVLPEGAAARFIASR